MTAPDHATAGPLTMPHRTRIKICGLTREQDVAAAVDAGADAIGLVFYPGSPRHVDVARAAALAERVPPFVSVVGLFVNADAEEVAHVAERVPLTLLQFHGDETPQQCTDIARRCRLPFVRAARVRQGLDLVEFGHQYADAAGLLLDAFVEGYGGGGHVFDWTLIPAPWLPPAPSSGRPTGTPDSLAANDAPRIVLSGGLNAQNVTEAVARVRPYAVDVSSGVEAAKGVKDAARIAAFVRAVRSADAG
ncbi:phosphoribosylanthranilate isomerase [Cupriavidus plantarum]|uniref:N-(5'-phosphoribosyl)anthranilate isomerase n=1 Tax=Cupriavidus plantarum TaxID=942865 RepID=A0A316EWV9_9BURK|nr:phosphoribosylanthranilate isomerase [Cupriavidus plantarum]PWK36726.1 phosphoribosylanthranilate isomerase [Cupriavidus plantarum]REF02538.1 phosphoribosylanthranilate isomerase [Cupriavidus plantarum]RLK44611.1 phosphoribosylanthranilate isomerase [Cupriavidus plantarum]CAG2150946.1 N-(5'-phosphoribosyl)anthranilate isomerase [Cupriavidus plantarum]SMR65814.1 phosphoribosylanthranilate isomerase [Cupriavidus plantarum]